MAYCGGLEIRGWAIRPTLAAVLMAMSVAAAGAQTSGAALVVETRDPSGAPLPDVIVVLVNQDTHVPERVIMTPQSGLVAIQVVPGTYTLSATRAGFKGAKIRDVRLEAATRGILTVTLTPGDYAEQVDVSASATTVRIGNSTVGAVFDAVALDALPSAEREALEFAVQAPGVSPPAPGSRLSTQGNTGVNSGGAREASNNYLLDGVDNNDLFLNRLVINPSLDAIEEVALLQNTYDAEYGRSAGAQINMVLKSGTSRLRGTAYEFFRHSELSARTALQSADLPTPFARRHQFGGTMGGPLITVPRSFFFANAEFVDGREADTRLAHVPTAAERSGVSASGATAAGAAILSLYPLPNRADAAANFVASPLGTRDAGQITVKTDYTLRPGTALSVRYSFSHDSRHTPFPVRSRNLPGFGIAVLDQGHNLAVNFSRAFSAHVFNEFRAGFNALGRENLPQSAGTDAFAALGLATPASVGGADLGFPTIVLPGYETLGDDPNLPVVRHTRTLHLSDAVTLDRGRHRFKTGGEFRTYQSNGYNHLFARGQMVFRGVFTGSPVSDLLAALPSLTLLGLNDNRQALRTHALNVFAQDDWRVTSRLTINLGARYEYNTPPYDADDRMRILNLQTLQLQPVGAAGVSRSGLRPNRHNLAPRAGASWDVTGAGTWMVRGGYGIFYDSNTLIENSALYFNPPYFTLQLFVPGAQPLRLENPFPAGRGFSPLATVNTIDPRLRTAFSQQASLGLERVFQRTTVAVRYVTSYGTNLIRKRNLNQPVPGRGAIDARRPIAGFADILLVESTASSMYHALHLSALRRPSRGLAFRAAYTLANAMDDASAFLATDGDDNTPQDSRNLSAEWGPSDFDVRHRLVVSATYNLPDRVKWRALRHVQASAILTAQSGRPFTPRVSFDNSNTGNVGGGTFAYDRPSVVSNAPAGVRAATYDGRTFVTADQYTFGNAGRNSLTGPSYVTVDALVARRVAMGGRWVATLRLEGFNVLNRTNYQLPDSFVDHPTFGRSLAAYAPRQLQLAVRFDF
jgi:hypothetical protein